MIIDDRHPDHVRLLPHAWRGIHGVIIFSHRAAIDQPAGSIIAGTVANVMSGE
jgi:hypothetical protein